MDFEGFIIGLSCFSIAFTISWCFLKKHDLNRPYVLFLVILSGFGHFLGATIFWLFALKNGGDSRFYFFYSHTNFTGLGAHFVLFMFAWLRLLFLGNSLYGAFLFSAAFGYLGSVFLFLTYKKILDHIMQGQKYFLLDKNILAIPGLVLLCWPSYFFWSAGLGKDSLSFFAIALLLYGLVEGRLNVKSLVPISLGIFISFLVRPYLFLIIGSSITIYILFMSHLKLKTKILWSILLLLAASKLLAIISHETNMAGYSVSYLSHRALENQTMTTETGNSSISVPTRNFYLMYLFIPYLMVANAFLPLFLGAKNMMVLISSFENGIFIALVFGFLKYRHVWKQVRDIFPYVNFLLIYFLVGMAFLSLINTNLGLAMREKMMYVPALLILMQVVYAYRKILIVKSKLANLGISEIKLI